MNIQQNFGERLANRRLYSVDWFNEGFVDGVKSVTEKRQRRTSEGMSDAEFTTYCMGWNAGIQRVMEKIL